MAAFSLHHHTAFPLCAQGVHRALTCLFCWSDKHQSYLVKAPPFWPHSTFITSLSATPPLRVPMELGLQHRVWEDTIQSITDGIYMDARFIITCYCVCLFYIFFYMCVIFYDENVFFSLMITWVFFTWIFWILQWGAFLVIRQIIPFQETLSLKVTSFGSLIFN